MRNRFSFKNLLGGRAAKEEAMDDEKEAMEDEDKAMEEGDEDKAKAEDMPEDDAAMDDGDDKAMDDEEEQEDAKASAEFRRGVKAGRKAERARIAGILAAATPATMGQAAELACNTGVSARDAKAILAAAPKASRLDAMMRGNNPPAPKGGGADRANDPDTQASRILANAGRAQRKETV